MRLFVLFSLLFLCFAVHDSNDPCLESELGSGCKFQATDSMIVYQSLRPTLDGTEAKSRIDNAATFNFNDDAKDTTTFPVDSNQNMGWTIGENDALVYDNPRRTLLTMRNLFAQRYFVSTSRDRKLYRAHGALTLIAWIVVAPLGIILSRSFAVSKSDGVPWQIWVKIPIFFFMTIGICIIYFIDYKESGTDEGIRHLIGGLGTISIEIICIIAMPFALNPGSIHIYNIINVGTTALGIVSVFLGIDAFDNFNDGGVNPWWITCVVFLGVYGVLAVFLEFGYIRSE